MEPIVSPWFIYLLHVVNPIRDCAFLMAVISGIGLLNLIITRLTAKYLEGTFNKNDKKLINALYKLSTFLFIPFFLIAVFTPSKKTLIWMFVAKNVTYQNVEEAIKAGKNVKDELKKDMLELIEAIKTKKIESETLERISK